MKCREPKGLTGHIKQANIHFVGEERAKGAENLFRGRMNENLPNLREEMGILIQEAQQILR